MKIKVIFASFKHSWNKSVSNDLLMRSTKTEIVNSHSFKIFSGTSLLTDLLLLRSLITCFTSFTETDWHENWRVIFKFCLIVLMLAWFTNFINHSSVNPTKWSSSLKQFVVNLLKNCLGVFDHFAGWYLKG